MKIKSRVVFLLASLLLGVPLQASPESLPPLINGQPPQTLDALWGNYDPRKEPLEIEVLKEWEQDGVVARIIRYQVGTFKGVVSKIAGFYCFPKGASKLPGLLQLHGGGQSASLDCVIADAKNGYASLSLNWGGNKMSLPKTIAESGVWGGPQTDWGALDATHPPQRSKMNHFAGGISPDEFTLDPFVSPRNSNWFIVLIAARRGLTFLQQQPEVDPVRLGVYGHSMGGKLTTNLAGIDRRVKAAVPSCGGCGEIDLSQTDLPGCLKTTVTPLERACISDNVYIPRITCPTLWLSPTNDFNATIDNMAWNWRNMPDSQLRLSITPHRNHTHDDAHILTKHLWFEQHLKQAFTFPQTPQLTLLTTAKDGVPVLTVTADASRPVKSVDIYYSVDPHPTTRFWRDTKAVKKGNQWTAAAPIMSLEQPLFAYADVTYDTPEAYRQLAQTPGCKNSEVLALSSRLLSASPAQWKAAGMRATDQPERLIDAGDRGWHDWYRSNWDHAPLWVARTAKLKDPKWRGPNGSKLVFEIKTATDNTLVVVIGNNGRGVYGKKTPTSDYVATKELKGSPDWQTVSVSLTDLVGNDPTATAPLADWQTVTDLQISPSYNGGAKGKVHFNGKAWLEPREIRNLHWEGGQYSGVQAVGAGLSAADHQRQFNDEIKKSLEQEKLDRSPQTTMLHPRLAAILKNNPLINARGNPVHVDRLLSKKYIFVYFSGYYCHPCHILTPRLIAFYKEQIKDGDFEFLFCDDFDRNKETMDKYMREARMPWPCLLYNDPAVAGLQALIGKAHMVPLLYLLDQNDEIIAKPTNDGTDHESWFPINKWMSLHGHAPTHWGFWDEYHKKFPEKK